MCIKSILKSNFHDYEIIISDDNSPRATEIKAVVDDFIRQYDNIKFYQQKVNLKEPGNKTFLAKVANGKYCIQLGDDDTMFKDTLIKIKEYINKFPGHDVYALGYNIIDEFDKIILTRKSAKKLRISISDIKIIKEVITFDVFPFWFFHPSVFCAKKGLEERYPYSMDAGIGEDYQFLMEILLGGRKIFVIPEALFNWRKVQNIGNTNQINQSYDRRKNILARKEIYYNYLMKSHITDSAVIDYVRSFEFRKRFLYVPLFVDPSLDDEFIYETGLSKEHVKEYLSFAKTHNKSLMRKQGKVNRAFKYVYFNGLSGLFEMIRLIKQKQKT